MLGASDPVYLKQTSLTHYHHETALLTRKQEAEPVKMTTATVKKPKIVITPIVAPRPHPIPTLSPEQQAMNLANVGNLEQAILVCREGLLASPTNKHLHFILAMALLELNKISEAEAHLRKVLYLDHEFIMAHYQLGLLLTKTKKMKAGVKCLQNALTLASAKDPYAFVPDAGDLEYGALTRALAHEIELYQRVENEAYAH